MKILLAFDSFKGCLTSAEAGRAAAQGVRRALPGCEVACLPVSDGGEGLLDALVPDAARRIPLHAHGPLMEDEPTCYGIDADGQTAVIETARIIGLPLVPPGRRNPLCTTSWGVGELIAHALGHGYRRFLVGLGGSSTNDAGLGMLQALGYRFYGTDRRELTHPLCGKDLPAVASVSTRFAHAGLAEASFTVACDVRNPLWGPSGAAYTFAPQKGADAAATEALDQGLEHIGKVMRQAGGGAEANAPGAGAAGGLGAAFTVFLKAGLKPGFRILSERLRMDERLENADLVFTGEGRSDRQTLMGKMPQGILEAARAHGIPAVLIAGSIEDADALTRAGFRCVFPIVPGPMALEAAMQPDAARENIARTVEQVCRAFTLQPARRLLSRPGAP